MDESFLRLKGRKVSDKETNKYFGRLSDILVNKDTNEILGIVAKNDSLIYRHRLFLIQNVCGYDELNLFVRGYGEKFVKVIPLFGDFISCKNDIMKKTAVLSDGSEIGKIQNINFEFETGVMTELEVGASIVQDLLTGRKICPTRQNMNYQNDKINIGDSS